MSHTNKQLLPNSFFRENPLEEHSAAMLTYASTYFARDDGFKEKMSKIAQEYIDDTRAARIEQQRQQIEQTDAPDALIDLMRKCDSFNSALLSEKVAAYAEQTMPLLLKKYCTCLQDVFIELANLVLARSDVRYTQTLRELYPQIRAPYAQAHACLTFGIQDMAQEVPFLLEQYRRFQRDYPEESFSQFPLLALYLLHGKSLRFPFISDL